jgi:prephenate dehydrogenase
MKFAQVYIIGNGVFGNLLRSRILRFYDAEVFMFDKGDKLWFPDATPEKPTLIIVATPINEIAGVLQTVFSLNPKNTYLTEVGSVKGDMCAIYNRINNGTIPFLSTHPMTGPLDTLWEEFDWKRKCLVVDNDSNQYELQDRLSIVTFWQDLGFVIKYISAKDHDRIIGMLSHLSHFMILAYSRFVRESLTPEEIDLAGTSFERFDKMALGAARLKDIYTNNTELLKLVDDFSGSLHETLWKIKETDNGL